MKDCVFCKIVKGEIPTNFVYKGKDVVAFRDINPMAPVHILIIPKQHISSLANVKDKDKDTLGMIQVCASKIAKKLGIDNAFRLLIASGEKAGQSVFHLHYHLVGGWKEPSIKMESEPGGLRK
jgi:histidine triad (HIT) family protein